MSTDTLFRSCDSSTTSIYLHLSTGVTTRQTNDQFCKTWDYCSRRSCSSYATAKSVFQLANCVIVSPVGIKISLLFLLLLAFSIPTNQTNWRTSWVIWNDGLLRWNRDPSQVARLFPNRDRLFQWFTTKAMLTMIVAYLILTKWYLHRVASRARSDQGNRNKNDC